MIEEEMEHPVKTLIVGNGAVGKSSMIQRYCKGIYTHDYKKTIGVDFLEKKIKLEGYELRLMIWDTAGQEEFDSMTKAYYRGAEACVVAFSMTDRDSFDAVESWIAKVEAEVGNIPMVLIMNKIDLLEQAVVTKEEAQAKADHVKLKLYFTSVEKDHNVNEVFQYLSEQFLKRLAERESQLEAQSTAKPKDGADKAGFAKRAEPAGDEPIRLGPRQRTKGKKAGFKCIIL
eukprot:m.39081 g.39081  ORF g.39081 m.39081 type:complete len:230 (-) comp11233_c0_seq1:256-945(-)